MLLGEEDWLNPENFGASYYGRDPKAVGFAIDPEFSARVDRKIDI